MMKEIWVIQEGSYSDYHIVGCFSTKAKAMSVYDFLRQHSSGSEMSEPVQWELDPGVDEIRKGYRPYRVLMLRDGSVEESSQVEYISSYSIGNTFSIWRRSTAPAYQGKGVPDCLDATIWAKNTKQAVKSVNEHRAQMIANGEWEK